MLLPVNAPLEPHIQIDEIMSKVENDSELFDENAWDDCDNIDLFVLSRARSKTTRTCFAQNLGSPAGPSFSREPACWRKGQCSLPKGTATAAYDKEQSLFEDRQDGFLITKLKFLPGEVRIWVSELF